MMLDLSRREFLKKSGGVTAALAAGSGLIVADLEAHEADPNTSVSDQLAELETRAQEQYALLFDSTLCIGCRSCEIACAKDNELGRTPEEIFKGRPAEDSRALAPNVFTYVTRHQVEADPSTAAFGKVQCMHCIEPACVSSCPVAALEKTPEGPVIWHEDLCLGCRYCMMACPFLVPRFEWDSANPRIRKCDMCHDRLLAGSSPACVEACPTKALVIGRRSELLAEAHRRIEQRPRGYVHHVYGEREAGGTNFLHLARRAFADLGYRRDLPLRSYRELTRPAMAAIPYVFNGLALLLGAAAWLFGRRLRAEDSRTGARQ
ncbi:MAG: 4Fe-4S dicluster domain-containing protein [Gemmatimonadales bacterium]